jgi:hypothetical protein
VRGIDLLDATSVREFLKPILRQWQII